MTDEGSLMRFELNDNPQKTNCLSTVEKDNMIIQAADGRTTPVYEVRNGMITIKGTHYPVKEIPHWVFYRRPPEGQENL